MNVEQLKNTKRMLSALDPASHSLVFLMTPDAGDGKPVLLVDTRRIAPKDKLALIRSGARHFAEGKLKKNKDGVLLFVGKNLSPKKLAAVVKGFDGELLALEGAKAVRPR